MNFILQCKECNEYVANSNNVLARHIRKFHNLDWPEYIVKHDYNSVWPVCVCGCNEKLIWQKGGFKLKKYNPRHGYRIANKGFLNPMYGLKGKNSPNYGKKRTKEHKENYRRCALKRWDEEYDERVALLRTHEYRQKMRIAINVLYETTNHSNKISAGIQKFLNSTDSIQYRNAARERAINMLNEGKIGPQAPYKTEWKLNQFTDELEYMHSSYESAFLTHCVENNIPVTKQHDVQIDYIAIDGIKHVYIPDFVSICDNVIYEIKGYMNENEKLKHVAARNWCKKNDWKFKVLTFDGVSFIEIY